jgi:hypothetical protein
MKIHLVALVFCLWGAIVCWLCVGCSGSSFQRTVEAVDPYQTCIVASLLTPLTADLAKKVGMTPEVFAQSACRVAQGLVGVAESVAESISKSTCPVPDASPAGVAGAPSWP